MLATPLTMAPPAYPGAGFRAVTEHPEGVTLN